MYYFCNIYFLEISSTLLYFSSSRAWGRVFDVVFSNILLYNSTYYVLYLISKAKASRHFRRFEQYQSSFWYHLYACYGQWVTSWQEPSENTKWDEKREQSGLDRSEKLSGTKSMSASVEKSFHWHSELKCSRSSVVVVMSRALKYLALSSIHAIWMLLDENYECMSIYLACNIKTWVREERYEM